MRRGSREKQENEPSPVGLARPPASRVRYLLCKKKKRKENEKLMREEESQGGRKSRRGKAEKEVGKEGREEKKEM